MKSYTSKINFTLVILLLVSTVSAQFPFYQSEQFDKATGLTEQPYCIDQDEEGFFWLGTRKGLFRFDGVQAVKINYLSSDTLSGAWQDIYMVSCDVLHHCIWVATEAGIVKYDRRTGRSQLISSETLFEKKEIHQAGAHTIFTDRQGETWSDLGVFGLVRLSPDGQKAESFLLPLTKNQEAAGLDWRLSNTITVIRQDVRNDRILWLGTRGGLLKFDKSSKSLERFYYTPENLKMAGLTNAVIDLYSHPDGKIYIGTWNGGMLIFDPAQKTFTRHFLSPSGWSDIGNTNKIRSILPDDNRHLWVSGSGGLYRFDTQNKQFSTPDKEVSLDFKDKDANYWQLWGGLRLYHRDKNQLTWNAIPVNCRPYVSEVPYDPAAGMVYLRTICPGGVYGLQVADRSWHYFPLPGRNGEEAEIKGYCATPAGFVIIDEKNQIYLKSQGSNQFQLLPVSLPARAGHPTMECGKNGQLFIAGYGGWLFRLDLNSQALQSWFKNQVNNPLPDNFTGLITAISDDQDRLWLRNSGGFSIYDPAKNSFMHIATRQAKGVHFMEYLDFIKDDKGKIWASGPTAIGWLDPLHPEQGIRQVYDKKNGFPYENAVFNFCENGKLWLITNRGLVAFDPETGKHRLFEHIKTKDIAFIGAGKAIAISGFNYTIFQLDSLRPNEEQPRPYISWFKVFEKNIPVNGAIFSPDKIRLKAGENFFSIGFSALGLYESGNIRFAYQLEGVDRDWVFPDQGVHSVSYTNISGGDYVFKVKATNSKGVWTEFPYELRIEVGTPWYKTHLAYLIYLLLIGGSIYSIWIFQKRRWELQSDLKMHVQESARLAELDAFKSRFFTNITHEFRTPLTLILGLSKEILDHRNVKTDPQLSSQVTTIGRNGDQLLQLVNQMLDLARIEAGSIALHPEQSDMMAYIRMLIGSFHSLAVTKNIQLDCTTEPAVFVMDFDPAQLQKVIANLVSNAIKYTPEHGKVLVKATPEGEKSLVIEVEDNGIGIPSGELELIFNRFYRGDDPAARHEDGIGIGLSLVKELVTLMGGTIGVQKAQPTGTIFRVLLPVTKVAPVANKEMPLNTLPVQSLPYNEFSNETVPEQDADLPVLLHVEDNPDLARYLHTLLQKTYRVIHARNGKEGLETALEQVPDIILSDIMMPEMDGFELCEKLKSDLRTSHIPVALLTAKATVPDKIQGLTYGADAYLMKPFDKEELLATLRNLLENRRRLVDFLTTRQEAPIHSDTPEVAKEVLFLQKVKAVIDAHISDDSLDMEQLSKELLMSRTQLHRKITALTGQSASLFVRAYRLEKAKELLETTTLSASEIAYKTGFSDPAYFSKCFKEAFGVPPGKWKS